MAARQDVEYDQQEPASAGFLLVRPAGRTHLGVKVPNTPGKGKC
jgi:hypothetical protein